ncbi:glycosyltransferase [Terrisporobacter sp.]
MLVSIIIPVYNAEKFIAKCLDSIKNQTYKNLEIILINDGSTDNSGEICEEYCKSDDRFKVIHKKNGGVSSARNLGLSKVSGDYICFIDPDDWIEADMIEHLYELTQKYNCDMGICGYYKEENKTILNKNSNREILTYSKYDALNKILDEEGFKGFLWNKIFSKKIIGKNTRFVEDIHFCEDLLFVTQCILNSSKIVYDNKPYYHYIIHENNVSKSKYSLKKTTSLDAIEKIIDLLDGNEQIQINNFKNYYMNMNISLLMNYIKENQSDKVIYDKLKNNLFKYNINDMTTKSVKLACLLSRINIKGCYFIWNKIN